MFDEDGESWPVPLLKGEEKGVGFRWICSPFRKTLETSSIMKVIVSTGAGDYFTSDASVIKGST